MPSNPKLKLFTCKTSTHSQIMATLGLGNFNDVLASIMIHTSHDVCAPLSRFLCIELAHPSSHPLQSSFSLQLLLICSILPLLFTYEVILLWSYCSPTKLFSYEAFVYFLYSSLVIFKVVIFHLFPFYLKHGVTFYDHKNALSFISRDFGLCDFATFHLLSLHLKFHVTS